VETVLALLAIAAVVLFALHGANVKSRRFNPLGYGLACAALVVLWTVIARLDH
jgi:hypothetical protein